MLQGNVNRWTQSFNRQSWRIRLRKFPDYGYHRLLPKKPTGLSIADTPNERETHRG
jgi:hypothetical protein